MRRGAELLELLSACEPGSVTQLDTGNTAEVTVKGLLEAVKSSGHGGSLVSLTYAAMQPVAPPQQALLRKAAPQAVCTCVTNTMLLTVDKPSADVIRECCVLPALQWPDSSVVAMLAAMSIAASSALVN